MVTENNSNDRWQIKINSKTIWKTVIDSGWGKKFVVRFGFPVFASQFALNISFRER